MNFRIYCIQFTLNAVIFFIVLLKCTCMSYVFLGFGMQLFSSYCKTPCLQLCLRERKEVIVQHCIHPMTIVFTMQCGKHCVGIDLDMPSH